MSKQNKDNFSPFYIFLTVRMFLAFIFILACIVIITPVVWLYSVTFDKEKRLYLMLTRFFARVFFLINGVNIDRRMQLNGLQIPKDGQRRIYVINHLSLLDGLLLFLLPGDIKFMAKDFYAKIPIFGLGMSVTGNISVKSGNQGQQLDMYMQAQEIVELNYPLVIFPEGTRSRTGKMGRFQNGPFMLALDTGAEIVPVVFDTWNALRPDNFWVRDTDILFKVLDPVTIDDYKDLNYKDFANRVKHSMMKELVDYRNYKREKSKRYYRHHPMHLKVDEEMTDDLKKLEEKIR